VLGTLVDNTERKRAEESLRESEAYLTEAQRLSHTGSWALDVASNRYLYTSEEFDRMFGFDPDGEPLTTEAVLERMHPEDRISWKRILEKSIRERLDTTSQYRIVLPDGSIRHIRTIRHPVVDGAGEVVKLVGTSIDITERMGAEEKLRASEARFRTFVDHATDAFFLHDDDLLIVDVNRQACDSLGYSREELIGMHPRNFDVGLDEPTLVRLAQRVGAGEASRSRRCTGARTAPSSRSRFAPACFSRRTDVFGCLSRVTSPTASWRRKRCGQKKMRCRWRGPSLRACRA
jgi:PAS domain S-box-containing protein